MAWAQVDSPFRDFKITPNCKQKCTRTSVLISADSARHLEVAVANLG